MDWKNIFIRFSLGILIGAALCLLLLIMFPIPMSVFYVLMTYLPEALLIILILELYPSKQMKLHMWALGIYWGYDMITKMTYYIDRDLFKMLNEKLAYGFIIFVGMVLVIGGLTHGRRRTKRRKQRK